MTPALFTALVCSLMFSGSLFYIDAPLSIAFPLSFGVAYTGGMFAAKYDNARQK